MEICSQNTRRCCSSLTVCIASLALYWQSQPTSEDTLEYEAPCSVTDLMCSVGQSLNIFLDNEFTVFFVGTRKAAMYF